MTQILDGTAVAAEIRKEVAAEVQKIVAGGDRPPGLAVLLVGDDAASRVYVRGKERDSLAAGFASRVEILPSSASQDEVIATIDDLNTDPDVDGFLVQLPMPDALPERAILEHVDPKKDVDGFAAVNVGRLWLGQETFAPATPSGIVELLRRQDIQIAGRHAVVVGRSAIVGKPMAALLLERHATVTVCHSRTPDLAAITRQADILVAAVGRPALIGPEHVTEGTVVIDVGINRITDRARVEELYPGNAKRLTTLERRGAVLTGDVDFVRVAPKARAITPVPGGVGPLTRAMLLVNTLRAARRRIAGE